jgi:23S rRNA (cytidine2498-2'-O)-methyltransferase
MHVLLSADESERFLLNELTRAFPEATHEARPRGLVRSRFTLPPGVPLPPLVFARQLLPDAQERAAASVRAWSELLLVEIAARLPEDQPWSLHVAPHYGSGAAGQHRCRLIREALDELLRRKRRHLQRQCQPDAAPFTPAHSLVQLLLTAPDAGLLSVAAAPLPFTQRRLISPFSKGELPVASDKAAPSRAFAKLLEAELRLGRRIARGETCADLGAAPGSWSYVALQRGARVLAVDRAPLRADLMRHPRLRFRQGDAFTFAPDEPVDWLLCDVIAAPERSINLLLDWARQRRARHFVVTIKFKGHAGYAQLDALKAGLMPLTGEFYLTRLCANKNEACAFGSFRLPPRGGSPENRAAQ